MMLYSYITNTKLNVVNGLEDISLLTTRKVIQLLEAQLVYMKEQNEDLSKQNQDLMQCIEPLNKQVCQLTKLYTVQNQCINRPTGKGSLFEDDPFLMILSRQKNKSAFTRRDF